MKPRHVFWWAVMTVVLMAGSAGITWEYANHRSDAIPESLLASPQFRQFVDTYELIRHDSIWHNTPQELLTGATNGMVATLHDQFTNYLNPSQTQALEGLLAPTYVGVGIQLSVGHPLMIQAVFPNTPAFHAGLAAGERIEAIDGHSVNGMNPLAAVNLIHGKPGTAVTLTVSQAGRTKTVRLIRQVIAYPTVFAQMLPGHVGYLAITEFGNQTGAEAVTEFHWLLAQGARGILLDLRNNPGGEVTQALEVANLFVPRGPVVTLKYKNPAQDKTYDSTGPGTRLPVVVAVNGNTASAAEILAAAIQERQGGWLVGTRTYGKGIVQEIIPLGNGASLKLTVAKYLTPNGSYIEHVGLKPNVVVPEPGSVVPSDNLGQDPQLMKAYDILRQRMGQS